MEIVRTEELTKKYRDIAAVQSVNMSIKQGEIYGFIGRNGAGKTTVIKMLTGLVHPTSGTICLMGKTDEAGLLEARKQMGAIVELPALFQHLTACQNLEHLRILRGIPDKSCIAKALKTVGLGDAGRKKVRDFSLGMKQRLGLAMALIGSPSLILLDEPTNGLDPAGMVEMRHLRRSWRRAFLES